MTSPARFLANLLNSSGNVPDAKLVALTASKLTGQVPDANAPSGSVIQVVQATKTDTASTSGTGFAIIPGFEVTITPSSAANRLLVCWTIWFGQTAQHNRTVGTLERTINGVIAYPFLGDADGSRTRCTWGNQDSGAIHGATYCAAGSFVDSPATTLAVRYRFAWSGEAGTSYINRGNEADGDSPFTQRLSSSLIVMEIAA